MGILPDGAAEPRPMFGFVFKCGIGQKIDFFHEKTSCE
jgi:hypothetical protein